MKHLVKRRQPSQERAQKTQQRIFESAVRLLEQEGLDRFTTNRLAQLSGISVGTIYQYFDDKRALLWALARHEHQRAMQEVRRLLSIDLANSISDEKSTRVRAVVRAMLFTFGNQHRAHRILLHLALQGGDHEARDHSEPTPLVTLLITDGSASQSGVAPALSETDAFVLTQALMGPINMALLGNARLFKKPQLEDSLVDLVDAFLRRRTGSEGQQA